MIRELTIRGRTVQITTGDVPQDARLSIDGTDIPLVYSEDFKGWGVAHTLYGFLADLERLAGHMIVSNPDLVIGHGHGEHDDHDGHDSGGSHDP